MDLIFVTDVTEGGYMKDTVSANVKRNLCKNCPKEDFEGSITKNPPIRVFLEKKYSVFLFFWKQHDTVCVLPYQNLGNSHQNVPNSLAESAGESPPTIIKILQQKLSKFIKGHPTNIKVLQLKIEIPRIICYVEKSGLLHSSAKGNLFS